MGRSPGEGIGYLLQYSCLENPMDRGAWWATVCGFTKVGHSLVTKQKQCAVNIVVVLHFSNEICAYTNE